VLPERACVWVKVYDRAQAAQRTEELKIYIPPRKRSLQGTSSYINYFLDRDSRPGNTEPLIQITAATASTPAVTDWQAKAPAPPESDLRLVK
jgi:hypothetical protein